MNCFGFVSGADKTSGSTDLSTGEIVGVVVGGVVVLVLIVLILLCVVRRKGSQNKYDQNHLHNAKDPAAKNIHHPQAAHV